MKVRILHPDGDVLHSYGTRFFLEDGSELKDVTRCVVTYEVDSIITATIELAIAPDQDIAAHPLLGWNTLRAAAEHYGYELVLKEPCVRAISGHKVKA